MTIRDVVKKLVGKVIPVGETTTDEERYKNMKDMCNLIEMLLMDIDDVAFRFKDSKEYSVKRSSDYAKGFLNKISKEFSLYRTEIEDLQMQLLKAELKEERKRLEGYIQDKDNKIGELKAENERLNERLNGMEKENKILRIALRDIKNWDDELNDKWGDPGQRASSALKK